MFAAAAAGGGWFVVRFEMDAQVGVSGKGFAAAVAGEGPVRPVLLLVVAQLTALRKPFPAHVARVATLENKANLYPLMSANFSPLTAESRGGFFGVKRHVYTYV